MNIINRLKTKLTTFTGVFAYDSWNNSFLFDKGKGLQYYEQSLYLNKAIGKRAEKLAQTEFVLKRGDREIENEWTRLLEKPNSYQAGDQFLETASKYYDIFGSVYILKEKGTLSGKVNALYLLRPDEVEVMHTETDIVYFKHTHGGKVRRYETDEIVYWYRPNPRNPFVGESIIASAVRSLETDIQISEYQANVLKNGGKLESIFKVKGQTTPDQLVKLREQYSEKYATARKSGQPLFLTGDLELITTGLKPAELAFLETKQITTEDIVITTGVPRILLGLGSKETYANAEQEIRNFHINTLKPIMDSLVDTLNHYLIPKEFELTYNDATPENVEQKLSILKTAHDVGALTTNEKRELLNTLGMELEPVKDGDEIRQPQPRITNSHKKYFLDDFNNRRAYEKRQIAKMETWEERLRKDVIKYFQEQQERVLKNTKALDTSLEVKLAKGLLLTYLQNIINDGGNTALINQGLDPNFTINSAIASAIDKQAEFFATEINETTQNKLSDILKSSTDRKEQEKMITELYDGFTKNRAKTIARTETHRAYQDGTYQGLRQAGVDFKTWVSAFNNSREDHMDMDGTRIGIDEDFILPSGNTCQYPGETGDPADDINCQCSL